MNTLFAETLKKSRTERGLSQIELRKQMFVPDRKAKYDSSASDRIKLV